MQNKTTRLSNDMSDSRNKQLHIGGQSYTNKAADGNKFATGINFNVNMFNASMGT